MEARPGTDRGAGSDPSTSSTPPEKASVIEDFLEIFYAPSKVFARREQSGYGMQLLIVSVLAAAFAFANRALMAQIFDIEFQRQAAKAMAANPQITQDMLNQGRGIQEAMITFGSYIGTPVVIFVMAFFVWLAAKIASIKVTYGQAALISTLAWIPRLLGALISTVQGVMMDTASVTSMFSLSATPARFMDPDTTSPALFAAMGSLELFSIWSWIVVGIGLSVIGKVSRGHGYTTAAALFVLGMLLTVVPAAFR